MQTMHPVIVFGSYLLDAENIPPDEFEVRIGAVQQVMAAEGWSALIAYGDPQDSSILTYLTNYLPRMRQAVALIPAAGPPRLLVWASPRDIKRETAIAALDDVRIAGRLDDALATWLDETRTTTGAIARAGGAVIRMPIQDAIADVCAARGLDLQDADHILSRLMQTKRPRELVVSRRSADVLGLSVAALADAWRNGASVTDAALEAERTAYASEAVDARTLFSLDQGRTLRPFERPLPDRPERFVGYVAVRYQAYWSEGFVTLTDRPGRIDEAVRDALDRLIAAAHVGARGRDLQAALGPSNGLAHHGVLGTQLGRSIGLGMNEVPPLAPDSDTAMVENGVYSLTVGLSEAADRHALVSAMVMIKDAGAEVLWRRP